MTGGRAALVRDGKNASGASVPRVPNSVGTSPNNLHGRNASSKGKKGSLTDSQLAEEHYDRIIRRYQLQATARELLPREAVARCMRSVIPRADGPTVVDVLYAPIQGVSHYGGLQMCKSVWLCPVCSAKISERRREELTAATRRWTEEDTPEPRRLLLVTLTLQHTTADPLKEVLHALNSARRLFVSGRKAKELSETYGMVGMVRALEITHGVNGWHPHLHILYFHNIEVPIIPFEADMKARWRDCVEARGRYASWANGCDVRYSDADIAAYLAKYGKDPKWTVSHEIAKSVSKTSRKGGRTPLQLLQDYQNGDSASGRLWLQYAVNLKGCRQLFWSAGLRDRLGLGEDKTDQEIAEEKEEIAVILASLSAGAWRVIVANDARGEVLEIASTGDADKLQAFLSSLGVGKLQERTV